MTADGPIFLPQGFKFSSASAGIKTSGKPDLGLILAEPSASAAALFTRNRIVAAPLEVGRAALAKTGGRVRAVLVNSGNANCATGTKGVRACRIVCAALARELKVNASEVFPSSTGIIGVPLPTAKINHKLRSLAGGAEPTVERLRQFSEAILTTDSRPKLDSVPLRSGKASITGIAKGAGMVHPQLATMLVYLLTDIVASPAELTRALRKACEHSFNLISIDGDTSTNDTVLLLASGQSRTKLQAVRGEFERALIELCRSLAEQIVRDGEGVGHVIRLQIEGAKSRAEALTVARTISRSLLVKTAWAGADPNWGRILAAVGRSGVPVDPRRIIISIGDQKVCQGSSACAFDQTRAHAELSNPESRVTVRLGRGKASIEYLTTDLTSDYVKLNAEYST
ncbi:MAG: bifunctional glutamate N-acetyltransferase/amino-acid acetyltransferase ArgJ [Acidobacteria bacterium]|nr:bifunctional glutamate N-acetyltransferase/amino-acid acetyltransferase ArgJ [Acidobacteriota bacterium]